jgi:uncharacterized protein YjbK
MESSWERELKVLLPDRKTFDLVRSHLPQSADVRLQENTFLDTPERGLRKEGLALRLRFEKDGYLLTVKGVNQGQTGMSLRREWECSISKVQVDSFLAGHSPAEWRTLAPMNEIASHTHLDLSHHQWKIMTRFFNERSSIPWETGGKHYTLELDRTWIREGQERYEVELEYNDPQDTAHLLEALQALWQKWDVTWRLSEQTKLAWVLNAAEQH